MSKVSKLILAATAACAATLAPPIPPASALECGGATVDELHLELESVTEDGQAVVDLAAYGGIVVTATRSYSDDRITVLVATPDARTWMEEYE